MVITSVSNIIANQQNLDKKYDRISTIKQYIYIYRLIMWFWSINSDILNHKTNYAPVKILDHKMISVNISYLVTNIRSLYYQSEGGIYHHRKPVGYIWL